MPSPLPHPVPVSDPADDRLVPRPLTTTDWQEWAASATVELHILLGFAQYCPADPELRAHVAYALRLLGTVSELLRDTLAAMDRAEQSPFPLEIHPAPPADTAHGPSPTDPATSRPFTPPR